jgi:hypothetical protein
MVFFFSYHLYFTAALNKKNYMNSNPWNIIIIGARTIE